MIEMHIPSVHLAKTSSFIMVDCEGPPVFFVTVSSIGLVNEAPLMHVLSMSLDQLVLFLDYVRDF